MKIAIQRAADESRNHDEADILAGPGPHDSGVHAIALKGPQSTSQLEGGTVGLFREMEEAYSQLDHEPLRQVLLESIAAERESVGYIASSFERFTQKKYPLDIRQTFFSSWQKTNNSAMSVEGLANRLTDMGEVAATKNETAKALDLFRSAGRLNRVTDEDLGVRGQVLHFELYYRMATTFADRNDDWQSRRFCLPLAAEFKSWLDNARMRKPLLTGHYSMLVHEGYTHAELEIIAPLFYKWATTSMELDHREAKKALAWITVHNGGTEKKHFAHSCAAFKHFCDATGTEVDLDEAGEVFRKYLRLKGAVMKQLDEML